MRSPFILLLALAACTSGTVAGRPAMVPIPGEPRDLGTTGLRYQDVQDAQGEVVEKNQCVYVHYTGYRASGQVFENSRDTVAGKPGEPLAFVLGTGTVIRGWDLGIEGMKIGSTRRLFIPPHLGYGSKGAGKIPPDVALVFDVQLMAAAESLNGACVPWRRLNPP